MSAATVIKKNVYYMGEMTYDKKWLSAQVISKNEDMKKMVLLSIVKQVFDSKVYKGPRCGETGCVTKGKCPANRKLFIILGEKSVTSMGGKGYCVIMIHAYKTGDELKEDVFNPLKSLAGNPIKIEFSSEEEDVEGGFAEVEDVNQIAEMKELMKQALTDESKAEVMALQSDGYEEQ